PRKRPDGLGDRQRRRPTCSGVPFLRSRSWCPRLPRRVPAPASPALVEVTREPGPLLPLVEEPAATHAAEELAGIDRLRNLLVRSDGGGIHAGQPSPLLRRPWYSMRRGRMANQK